MSYVSVPLGSTPYDSIRSGEQTMLPEGDESWLAPSGGSSGGGAGGANIANIIQAAGGATGNILSAIFGARTPAPGTVPPTVGTPFPWGTVLALGAAVVGVVVLVKVIKSPKKNPIESLFPSARRSRAQRKSWASGLRKLPRGTSAAVRAKYAQKRKRRRRPVVDLSRARNRRSR